MSDPYRTVTTRFRGVAPSGKAFFVDRPANDRRPGALSVPRSLIHGVDDAAIERCFDGEEYNRRSSSTMFDDSVRLFVGAAA